MLAKVFFGICVFSSATGFAQLPSFVAVDPTTAFAVASANEAIKNMQQKQIEQQTKLQAAQAWVGAQLTYIGSLQKKLEIGLTEVSGTITNGMIVMEIKREIFKTPKLLEDIKDIAGDDPKFIIFSKGAVKRAYQEVAFFASDLNNLINSDPKNLMTSGDRSLVLERMRSRIKQFNLSLYSIKMTMERAKKIGFWRSINPFDRYIQTDKSIVQNIIRKYEHLMMM